MFRSWLTRLGPSQLFLALTSILLYVLACGPASTPDDPNAAVPSIDDTAAAPHSAALANARHPNQLFPPCNRYDSVQDQGPLPPLGEAIERPFTESYEVHRYSFDVEAGDYVHVVVEQQNVDLVVSLVDETGQGLLRVDSLYSALGQEEAHFHSQYSGQIHLLVCGPRTLSKDPGYRTYLSARHPASEEEAKMTDAFRVYQSAEAQRRRNTDASKHKALELYHRATEEWQALGRIHDEALAFYGIGRMHFELRDDFSLARKYSEIAAVKFKESGDRYLESAARHRLGLIHAELGDNVQSIRQYEISADIRKELGHSSGHIRTAVNLARGHRIAGSFRESRDLLEKTLEYTRSLDDDLETAKILHELGTYYLALDDNERALEMLEQALQIRLSIGDMGSIAESHFAIGDTLKQANRFQEAINYLDQALQYHKSVGNRAREANTLITIGTCHIQLEDYETAQSIFDKALKIALEENLIHAKARSNLYIGWIKAETGRCRESIQDFHLAAEIFRHVDLVQSEVISLQNISICHLWLGETEEAVKYGLQATTLAEKIRANALSMSWQAKFFSIRRHHFDSLIDALMQRAEEVSPLESTRFLEQAIEISERAKARSLLDGISENEGGSSEVDTQDGEPIKQIIESMNGRLSQSLLALDADPSRYVDPESRYLLEKLEIAMRHRAEARAPRIQNGTTLNAQEILEQIGPDTTLLKFHIGYWKGHIWLVDKKRILHFSAPNRADLEQLVATTYRSLSSKARPVQTQLLLENFSNNVLQEVLEAVQTKSVLLVADGPLNYLPFDALPYPNRADAAAHDLNYRDAKYLGDKFEFSQAPSISVLAAIRKRNNSRSPTNRTIQVIADPVFNLDDSRFAESSETTDRSNSADSIAGRLDRLKFSNDEANAIGEIAARNTWDSKVITGFGATKANTITPELRQASVLHFATHAEIHSLQPEFAHLAFSQFDREGGALTDNNLFVYELYNMQISADLVVLSACSTALGSDIQGEGLVGLTQGFIKAGAQSVLVSLWKVDDRATARLMRHFYENLLEKQLRPADALWKAKMSVRQQQQWREPYFWAGFALLGDSPV